MSKNLKTLALAGVLLIAAIALFGSHFSTGSLTETSSGGSLPNWEGDIPARGMVTMLDLGSNECLPCKMMAPILQKMEQKYQGRAAVIYVDVYKNKDAARRFGIRAIPTQIFFDEKGQEVYRHEGFMGEADIERQFQKMGVG